MTATHTQPTTLRDRLVQVTKTVSDQLDAFVRFDGENTTGDEKHRRVPAGMSQYVRQLESEDGLVIDGCAVWLVDGELRSFTCCTCCGSYAELAVKW